MINIIEKEKSHLQYSNDKYITKIKNIFLVHQKKKLKKLKKINKLKKNNQINT